LIPGATSEEVTTLEDGINWERTGDTLRSPEPITLVGDLLQFDTPAGLRYDVLTLSRFLETATSLCRVVGSATRVITLDGGEITTVVPRSLEHYLLTITLYPASQTITSGTPATIPTLGSITDENDEPILDQNDRAILAVGGNL